MTRQPAWTHDRRRALRVDVPARAALEVRLTDVDELVSLRQISTGGLVVTGHEALHPESAYDVRLAVAGHRTLDLDGRVVYTRTTMAVDAATRAVFISAIAFEHVHRDDLAELSAIVAELGGDLDAGAPR